MSGNQLFGTPQDDAYNHVNNLLSYASSSILCGPACQSQKKTDELKQLYLNAQKNVKLAPSELYTAKKNYYVNVDGVAEYNKMSKTEYEKEVNALSEQKKTEFNRNISFAKTLLGDHKSLYNNFEYVNELYETYVKKNADLKKSMDDKESDSLTNDRKTYYETQHYDYLTSWYYILIRVYVMLVVVFLIAIFLAPSGLSYYKKMGILFLILIYPFVINYIVLYFLSLTNKISSALPKNVYADQKATSSD